MESRMNGRVLAVIVAGVFAAVFVAMIAMQSVSNPSEARSTAVVNVPVELKFRSEPANDMYYYASWKNNRGGTISKVFCKTGGSLNVPRCSEGKTYRKFASRPFGKRTNYRFNIISSQCADGVGIFRSGASRSSCVYASFDRQTRVAKNGAAVRGFYDKGPNYDPF